MNSIYARVKSPQPEVGMGASILYFSDRSACTIIEASDKMVVVQRDKVFRVDQNGMSESQQYDYERDPDGVKSVFTLRKNGRWVLRGDDMKGGTVLLVGVRSEYYDYSF